MTGGSAPKRKGSAFENAVVSYLRRDGFSSTFHDWLPLNDFPQQHLCRLTRPPSCYRVPARGKFDGEHGSTGSDGAHDASRSLTVSASASSRLSSRIFTAR